MATYLVERYWPGVTSANAQAETARLTALLSGGETRIVETFVTAADEVCFWHVEAETAAHVEAAFAAADIPIDRISAAQALPSAGPTIQVLPAAQAFPAAGPADSALAAVHVQQAVPPPASGRHQPARCPPPVR